METNKNGSPQKPGALEFLYLHKGREKKSKNWRSINKAFLKRSHNLQSLNYQNTHNAKIKKW